jgi:hypothetical protein
MKFTFTGTIANFIDSEWILIEQLVDFQYVEADGHKGYGAALAFVKSPASRGGLPKISAVTMKLFIS